MRPRKLPPITLGRAKPGREAGKNNNRHTTKPKSTFATHTLAHREKLHKLAPASLKIEATFFCSLWPASHGLLRDRS